MVEVRAPYNPDVINNYVFIDGAYRSNPDLPIFGFYNSWVGGEDLSLAFNLYFMLLPIGAALPYAWSYYTERKNGYIKNIASRISKKKYIIAKTFAIFCSGALVVFISVVANILFVSAFVPIIEPYVGYNFYNHVSFGYIWADLYFVAPWLYVLLFVLLETFYGGIFAILSLAISFYIKNIFAVIFLPFVSMIAVGFLEDIFYSEFYNLVPLEFNPTFFIHSLSINGQRTPGVVLLVTLILLVFSLGTIITRGFRDEIF